jgi:hypothetical protein
MARAIWVGLSPRAKRMVDGATSRESIDWQNVGGGVDHLYRYTLRNGRQVDECVQYISAGDEHRIYTALRNAFSEEIIEWSLWKDQEMG